MCSHTKIPHWVLIKGFPLRSRGQKWIQDLSKPYKYPFKIKRGNKGKKKKLKEKIRKGREISIKNISVENLEIQKLKQNFS
jgi:hypothetical protein